ncbi:MAG TPA: hypothetical protein HPP94_10835 [Desulfuromonadales bacterium]|nr:hypothetical protein [Desulfuromonadales bacterium]
METAKTCSCGESHQGHICVLRSKGLTKDVEHLTNNPTVSCFTCGVEANSAENVCSPIALS